MHDDEGEEHEALYHQEMTHVWAGPMPPSFELANLDKVVPGLAREVADEFRAEAKNRRRLENRKSKTEAAAALLGYLMAAGFAFGCFFTIWHAIEEQAYATAGIIATGALVGGISAFLGNAALQRKTRVDEPDTED